MIGVQHNAVSIVAHALRKDGIIRYGRGNIEVYKSGGFEGTPASVTSVKATHQRLLKAPH